MKKRTIKKEKTKIPKIWILIIGLAILIFSYLYSNGMYDGTKNKSYFIMLLLGTGIFYISLFSIIKNPYNFSWKYLKESKNYFYFVVFAFILSALLGFIFYENLRFLDDVLRELVKKTQGLSILELINFILFNNIQVSFLGLFLGIFFGIFSFFNILSNGFVLGYVFHSVWSISGLRDFWRILPHGIFELPAIFISLGLGMKLGMFIFSKKGRENIKQTAYTSLIIFLFIIVPLLIIASIIESLLISIL